MSWILGVVVALVAGLAALGSTWFLGMRRKWRPVLDLQRRVNRALVNPRQLRSAGTPGAYAGVVHHVGRRSSREYRTPVVPFPAPDGFVVALPYGTRPDWVRNVLAAGAARIDYEGETCDVSDPQIVSTADAPITFPESEQRAHLTFDVRECLVLHRRP